MDPGCEFFVIIQKRRDEKIYSDLHKTDGKIYLDYEDAKNVLRQSDLSEYLHIVKMVAYLSND